MCTLLPSIRERATGGNLFNRQVLEPLATEGKIELLGAGSGESDLDPTGPLLVDSLMFVSGQTDWVKRSERKILLAHYLHLLDSENGRRADAARERALLPRLDGAVTTSRYSQRILVEAGLAPERVLALMPGLARAFHRPRGPLAESQAPRLLTVANVLPGKGLQGLVQVLESLDALPWQWRLAGDFELDSEFGLEFRSRVSRSSIAPRTRLLGVLERDRLIEEYDHAEVLVLPSRFETCSMATMEAMARGLPVVAHSVGGLPELLSAPGRRLLAPAGDLDALRDRLRECLGEPHLAASLGRENRRAAREFPSWEQSAERLVGFLATVAEGAR